MLARNLAFLLLWGFTCSGAIIAYDYPTSIGNQTFGGPLGMDFDVNSSISITSLGVYDSGADGLGRQITAYIYDRNTGVALASLVFNTGATGTLINGARFLPLAVALNLSAGFQGSIVAENYGDLEPNLNNVLGSLSTLNTGGGAISFVGTSRYGLVQGAFPSTIDSGPANRYGAGTFIFETLVQEVPEPSTMLLAAAGLLCAAYWKRRVS